jgi:hypothetical protein
LFPLMLKFNSILTLAARRPHTVEHPSQQCLKYRRPEPPRLNRVPLKHRDGSPENSAGFRRRLAFKINLEIKPLASDETFAQELSCW